MALKVGDIAEGTVTGITKFGVFIKLDDGQSGLVHISEIADTYIKDIAEHIKVQDKVKVCVLQITQEGKLDLSIRRAQVPKPAPVNTTSFEDQMERFFKDSEERLLDVRKNQEHKRKSYSRSR